MDKPSIKYALADWLCKNIPILDRALNIAKERGVNGANIAEAVLIDGFIFELRASTSLSYYSGPPINIFALTIRGCDDKAQPNEPRLLWGAYNVDRAIDYAHKIANEAQAQAGIQNQTSRVVHEQYGDW